MYELSSELILLKKWIVWFRDKYIGTSVSTCLLLLKMEKENKQISKLGDAYFRFLYIISILLHITMGDPKHFTEPEIKQDCFSCNVSTVTVKPFLTVNDERPIQNWIVLNWMSRVVNYPLSHNKTKKKKSRLQKNTLELRYAFAYFFKKEKEIILN